MPALIIILIAAFILYSLYRQPEVLTTDIVSVIAPAAAQATAQSINIGSPEAQVQQAVEAGDIMTATQIASAAQITFEKHQQDEAQASNPAGLDTLPGGAALPYPAGGPVINPATGEPDSLYLENPDSPYYIGQVVNGQVVEAQ